MKARAGHLAGAGCWRDAGNRCARPPAPAPMTAHRFFQLVRRFFLGMTRRDLQILSGRLPQPLRKPVSKTEERQDAQSPVQHEVINPPK